MSQQHRNLPSIFQQTISPNPEHRKSAENFLCNTINNNPEAALDILSFATDWGCGTSATHPSVTAFSQNQNDNPPPQYLAYSRLAASIFIKNLILRSPWGSGELNDERFQQQQQQNNNNASGGSELFSGFRPSPQLQQTLRSNLVAATVGWRPPVLFDNSSSQQQQQQQSLASTSSVDETIRRYIETAVESIHNTDWPVRWQDLFDNASGELSSNAIPACGQVRGVVASSSQQNSPDHNIFLGDNSNSPQQQIINNLCNGFAESLTRGAAALSIIKMCCRRVFDPDAVAESPAAAVAQKVIKQMGEKNFVAYGNELLGKIGGGVLAPFLQIVAAPEWSQLFLHASVAETELKHQIQKNQQNGSQQQQQQQQQQAILQQIVTFQKAWQSFTYEGLKSLFHVAQTQQYGGLLDAEIDCVHEPRSSQATTKTPFIFATVKACLRIHDALQGRLLMRRFLSSSSQTSSSSSSASAATATRDGIFQLESRSEQSFWRLWKRCWALIQHLFHDFGDVDACPKKIRSSHRAWISEHFAPAVRCAVAMAVVHENKQNWMIFNSEGDFSSQLQQFSRTLLFSEFTSYEPSQFARTTIIPTFVEACARDCVDCVQNAGPQMLLLAPFAGAQHRVSRNASALSFALDVIETSLMFVPWLWWDNVLFFSNQNTNSTNNRNYIIDILSTKNNFPEVISPLFVPAGCDAFTQSLGCFSWFFIVWMLLPRMAMDADDIETWEVNPLEYLNAQTDPNRELFTISSAATRLVSSFINAQLVDKASKREQKMSRRMQKQQNQQQQQQQNTQNVVKQQLRGRVHFVIDSAFGVLARASNEGGCANISRFDGLAPSPALLAADSALQVLRLTKHALIERADCEEALLGGVLPLFQARFPPLRAKAALVICEIASTVTWKSGETAFQRVLTATLDLMYDSDLAVRMQVCSRLSPLVRHPLAGTVVVPHLVRIVEQFFTIMSEQNQSDIIVRTLRKLFAHYKEHVASGVVDLARVILGKFLDVVKVLVQMDEVQQAQIEQNQEQQQGSEFASASSTTQGNNNNNMMSAFGDSGDEAIARRDLLEATAVGDELLDAVSTLVKCVPRLSTYFYDLLEKQEKEQQQAANSSSNIRDQLEQHAVTMLNLQELCGPMLQQMFESPNSMGFFEGGLKLITNILARSVRLHPNLWNIFSALFKIVCVRNVTDYFTNMIGALDNFASADPVGLVIGSCTNNNQNQNQNQQPHPAEESKFIVQALAMVRCICEQYDLPLSDVANAVQCIDCFLLNGSKIIPESVIFDHITREEQQHRQNINMNSSKSNSNFNSLERHLKGAPPSFDQICNLTNTNDPLHILEFVEVPRIVVATRNGNNNQQQQQSKLPELCQQNNLLATPSMCILLSNSVFCCVVSSLPQMLLSNSTIQSRALMSFQLVARLFDEFGGVGSGDFHRQSSLASRPLSFRVYDRKLFVLAVSHFVRSLSCQQQNDNNTKNLIIQTLQQEGYGSSPDDCSNFIQRLLWTAILMSIENSYYDSRLLSSLFSDNNNNSNQNEFFSNSRDFDSEDDGDEFDDSDNNTDVTTDDDGDDFGFGGDDGDDDDQDDFEDFNDGDEDDDFYGDDGNNRHDTVERLAAAAAAARGGGGGDAFGNDDDDNFFEEDDFHENLLLENPGDRVETPLDDVDEYRVLREAVAAVMSGNEDDQFSSLVRRAINNLVQQYGAVPTSRCQQSNNNSSSSRRNRRKQQQQQNQEQQQQRVFAFFQQQQKNDNNQNATDALPLSDFLTRCSQQRDAIQNAVM